jgi:Pentapeptide repeats (8 copies)
MRWPVGRLGALAILATLALLTILLIPRLLYPPLSSTRLQRVPSEDKRVELEQAQARLQNDARATLLQGFAGLLLAVGAVATWRQVQVNREGQITERFARAVDQLGSSAPDVRLGGIYTLERIAKDSPPDRPTVVAVLGALVRAHAPWLVDAPDGPQHPTPTVDRHLSWLQHRAPDVQAALSALAYRPVSPDELPLYLSRVDLRGAYLPGGRLAHAMIRHTNLARAGLSRVSLKGSDLRNSDLRLAYLEHAELAGAKLYQAYLQEADLRGANLVGADLREANFHGADLRGANLALANLEDADLTDVRYDVATLWPAGFEPPRPPG